MPGKASYEEVLRRLAAGDARGALAAVRRMEKRKPRHPWLAANKWAILAECGIRLGDRRLISQGIAGWNRSHAASESPSRLAKLAEAHLARWELQRPKAWSKHDPRDGDLQNAKRLYRKALSKQPSDQRLRAEMWTNLGNCFDCVGRSFDALECYGKATSCQADFAMARGNIGVTLRHFAGAAGENQARYLLEAAEHLRAALAGDLAAQAADVFRANLRDIEKWLSARGFRDDTARKRKNVALPKQPFAKKHLLLSRQHDLFLNLCLGCHRCPTGDRDSLFPTFITSLDDDTPYEFFGRANDLREEYFAARYLFVRSQMPGRDVKAVDRILPRADTLEYAMHCISIQLMRTVVEKAMNILDKVAFFVADYLALGMPERAISFYGKQNIWTWRRSDAEEPSMAREMARRGNPALFALHDICLDFCASGADPAHFQRLRDLRNWNVHRYLIVHEMMMLHDQADSKYHIHRDELHDRAVHALALARKCIVYLFHFVRIEEERKKGNAEGPIGEIELFPLWMSP